MHPEILRDLILQHGQELREQAHRAMIGRAASRARRDVRRRTESAGRADDFVVPAIPDYVDGSFRSAADEATSPQPSAMRRGA
jgi:hypothetical protein